MRGRWDRQKIGLLRNVFHYFRKLPLLRGLLNKILFKKLVGDRGERVSVKGPFHLTRPSFLKVGSHVRIGRDVRFRSEGGILIGDNSLIGDNVLFDTVGELEEGTDPWKVDPQPILIGREAHIGKGVCLKPGARVSENGHVPEGSVVEATSERNSSFFQSGYVPEIRKRSFTGMEKGRGLFFVLSTGRSGSKSITDILSQHPSIQCRHESKAMAIRLSVEHLHGTKPSERIQEELEHLFGRLSIYKKAFQGESDHRFSVLLPYLQELLPEARFIWLIRNGMDFVSSAYSRGWFSDEELGFKTGRKSNATSWKWARYRPQAHLCNDMEEEEWRRMSPFARNCWYWNFWNQRIQEGLADHIPEEQRMMVRLEDLKESLADIQNFIGVVPRPLKAITGNKASHERYFSEYWKEDEVKEFQYWCGDLMERLYPDDKGF